MYITKTEIRLANDHMLKYIILNVYRPKSIVKFYVLYSCTHTNAMVTDYHSYCAYTHTVW